MPSSYMTITDVVNYSQATLKDVEIGDVLTNSPVVKTLPVVVEAGSQHRYLVRTADPAGGFRAINDGKLNVTSTRSLVTLDLKFLDGTFDIDIATYMAYPQLYGFEAAAALQGAWFGAEKGIINGDSGSSLKGLKDAVPDLDATMMVNAGGTTATTGSSVYAVYANPVDGVSLVVGNGGLITVDTPVKVSVAGSSTGEFTALRTNICSWLGIRVGGTYQVGRICNLTNDSGKGLTDALLSNLWDKFPAGKKPNFFIMNSRSLGQLRRSRTAVNPTGSEAPYPQEVFGAQILMTDAITSTESIIVAHT